MKNVTKGLFMAIIGMAVMTSCNKYKKYDNNEIIEDTFTGNATVDNNSDPDGNFNGNGDNGTFSFAWVNTGTKASVKFDITATDGTLQLILNDKKGKEVFNQTLSSDSNIDSFEGISDEGKTGTWKVSLIFTNFKGSGSYELDPVN